MINMTRGVYYEMLSCQRLPAVIAVTFSVGDRKQGSVREITQVRNVWLVLMLELMSKTCINPQAQGKDFRWMVGFFCKDTFQQK